MKITFKETNDGSKNEIYVNGNYIGSVLRDIKSKWRMEPSFLFFSSKETIKLKRFDSFYDAGKYLAKLYSETYSYFNEYEEDTQDIDMREVFSQRGP